MDWYLTKIVYRIVCGDGHHRPQFDEQLRLIQASGSSEAFEKATSLGQQEAFSFLNHKQQIVHWQFINIAELNKLPVLDNGVELYSRVEEADHAGKFIELINHKAEIIRSSV